MNIPHTQIKALALLFVFVVAFSFSEYKNLETVSSGGQQQTAGAFDSIASFLGIQTGSNTNSNTNVTGDYVNDADAYFSNISDDPFNSASTQTNINTPSANVGIQSGQTTQTNQVGTGPLATRGVTLICIPPIIGVSEETIIMWACRDGAYTTVSENFDSVGETIGTVRVQPTEDTTYTIECVNDLVDVADTTASCVVNVAEPVLTFSADSLSIDRGDSIVLSWTTTDVNSCLLTSDTHLGFTRRGIEGQVKTPAILRDTIFRLTCESESGLLQEEELEIDPR
ncbi:hypothetical protein JXR01_02535 [Candidatus Kaiserbacteria bacterium]|nr:MAG: hypothetical protein JXR01_02535 [Candidatus Kaiserbacteria bacterium]